MKAALECNIIRDILPLYAERLTSEESNNAIIEHIEHCEACRKVLENLQKPIDSPLAPKIEADYMRKVKRSFKRRNYMIMGIISIACLVFLSSFLRFFIIGYPMFFTDAPINYEWHYDAESETFSIQGNLGWAGKSARIKSYVDNQNNQIKIKIYELLPSIFYNSNVFSVEIPWDGEMDIIWQGNNDQIIIMSSQYMSLFISEYNEGQYEEVANVFDMEGAFKLQQIYNNAQNVSDEILNSSFSEEKYDHYLIILLPTTSGTYETLLSDEILLENFSMDERIFLYQEEGQYYFYKEGQPLKKASMNDVTQIREYIESNN